jgi:branched-subunit amino acid transport protein AzlD
MKLARQQVLGSLVLAVIVLIILLIRAWPYLSTNDESG